MKKRTKAEQAELLNRPIEDLKDQPVVKDLLSDEFVTKSDREALDVTQALAELLRGQRFLSDEVAKMREKMTEYDKTAARFNEDKEKFIQEVLDRSESLKDPSGKATAKGAIQFEHAVQAARAAQATSRLKFEQDLATMPKVTLTVVGIPETLSRSNETVITPEVIRIRHKTWVLQPGVPTEVPKIVADRYAQIQEGRAQTREYQMALKANLQDTELSRKLRDIEDKYKSGGDSLPIGSTA